VDVRDSVSYPFAGNHFRVYCIGVRTTLPSYESVIKWKHLVQCSYSNVNCEVIMAVTIKITIFQGVRPR
jgi:hypothetical protein